MDQRDFDYFRKFLHKVCGIHLGENKKYLVTTRVRPILSEHNLDSLSSLVSQLERGTNRRLKEQVVDVMTTNETFWFRDTYPFDYLKNNLLPDLMAPAAGASALRVWSAACSSGQEPYSISMTAEEYLRLSLGRPARPVEIVATDLSPSVMAQARSAEYDKLTVTRGLSQERLEAFFDKLSPDTWRVKPAISRRVNFKPLNLMDSFQGLGKFDLIFCRNVLIYFEAELKTDILTRMHEVLKPGGLLFLGSSEGVSGATELFEMVHCNPGIMYRAR